MNNGVTTHSAVHITGTPPVCADRQSTGTTVITTGGAISLFFPSRLAALAWLEQAQAAVVALGAPSEVAA
jgi:hypothetical protein